MRKDQLLKLIADYDKNKWFIRADNATIGFLKLFMASEKISLLNDEDDIRYSDFLKWMKENIAQFDKYITEEYLKGESKSAVLFNQFIQAEKKESEPKETKSKETKLEPTDPLSTLPRELLAVIAEFTDSYSLINLSKTSSLFSSEITKREYWQNKIIKEFSSVISKETLDEVIKSNAVTDYKKLHFLIKKYLRVRGDATDTFRSWELICLSGNEPIIMDLIKRKQIPAAEVSAVLRFTALSGNVKAIDAVALLPGINFISTDRFGLNPLHFAALSGNRDAINAVAKLPGISLKSGEHGRDILECAALSGNPDAIRAVAKLLGIINPENDPKKYEGYALHFAALSGNPDAIMAVAMLPGIKLDKTLYLPEIDREANVMHFAALSGNPDAIKTASLLLNQHNSGKTLLCCAVKSGSAKAIQAALAVIPDPEAANSGFSGHKYPIHYAAELGNPETIKLIAALPGVEPDIKDRSGMNALHYAAKSGNLKAIRATLALEIDPLEKDNSGKTFIDYCFLELKFSPGILKAGLPEMVRFIRRFCFENSIEISDKIKESLGTVQDEEVRKALQMPVEQIPSTGVEKKKGAYQLRPYL